MAFRNSGEFGGRYAGAPVVVAPEEGADGEAMVREKKAEAVIEFVMYLYEFIRNDQKMVDRLNEALKRRYSREG